MEQDQHDKEVEAAEDDTSGLPPFVKTWKQLYGIVIAELVVLIALFYWFTKTFE